MSRPHGTAEDMEAAGIGVVGIIILPCAGCSPRAFSDADRMRTLSQY